MTDLKFRAYDTKLKQWVAEGFHIFGEVTLFNLIGQYCYDTRGDGDSLQRYNDIAVTQCTGLKDKNGKDIYESDVLEIRTQFGRIERFTVVYGTHRRDMKSGWMVDIQGFAFVDSEGFPTFPIVNNYLNGHDLDIIEVIGNIYQNPELLTS